MKRWFRCGIGNVVGVVAGIVLVGMTGAFGREVEAGEFPALLDAQEQKVRAALDCVAGRDGSPAGCLAFARFGKVSAGGTWCGLPAAVERALSVPGLPMRCAVTAGFSRRWRRSSEDVFLRERDRIVGLLAVMRARFEALPRVQLSEAQRAERLWALEEAAEAVRKRWQR